MITENSFKDLPKGDFKIFLKFYRGKNCLINSRAFFEVDENFHRLNELSRIEKLKISQKKRWEKIIRAEIFVFDKEKNFVFSSRNILEIEEFTKIPQSSIYPAITRKPLTQKKYYFSKKPKL